MLTSFKIYDSVTGALIGVAETMSFSSERNVQQVWLSGGGTMNIPGRTSHTCRFGRMLLDDTVNLDLMKRIETTITTDDFGVGRLAGYVASYSRSLLSGGTIILDDVQVAVDTVEPGFGFDQEAYEEYLESKFVF